jgi:N-methylhydantoinase B/oxoprolinase/acetone carboxylase alpha subunit
MLPDPIGGVGIERRGRLVEQQHVRIVDQRLRQRDAGLLPGRQLAVGAVEEVAEIEIGGQFIDPRLADVSTA